MGVGVGKAFNMFAENSFIDIVRCDANATPPRTTKGTIIRIFFPRIVCWFENTLRKLGFLFCGNQLRNATLADQGDEVLEQGVQVRKLRYAVQVADNIHVTFLPKALRTGYEQFSAPGVKPHLK